MLMRWDPFHELDRMTDWVTSRRPVVPLDAYRRGHDFVIHFDLPGVDPESIDLTVERNVLTVRAERRFLLNEDDEALVAERPQGTFSRQVFLGETLEVDKLDASYDEGVLTVTIPVAEAARPRKIEIGASRKARAITTGGKAS